MKLCLTNQELRKRIDTTSDLGNEIITEETKLVENADNHSCIIVDN